MALIEKEKLIAEYDRVHVGPPGGARKLMEEAEEVQAITVEWIENFLKEEYNKGFKSDALLVAYGMIILYKWREEQSSK